MLQGDKQEQIPNKKNNEIKAKESELLEIIEFLESTRFEASVNKSEQEVDPLSLVSTDGKIQRNDSGLVQNTSSYSSWDGRRDSEGKLSSAATTSVASLIWRVYDTLVYDCEPETSEKFDDNTLKEIAGILEELGEDLAAERPTTSRLALDSFEDLSDSKLLETNLSNDNNQTNHGNNPNSSDEDDFPVFSSQLTRKQKLWNLSPLPSPDASSFSPSPDAAVVSSLPDDEDEIADHVVNIFTRLPDLCQKLVDNQTTFRPGGFDRDLFGGYLSAIAEEEEDIDFEYCRVAESRQRKTAIESPGMEGIEEGENVLLNYDEATIEELLEYVNCIP